MIPQTFIDDLLTRLDIVDVIGTRIALKKMGAHYKALCPFHNEKTPSFNVNQSKQFYHCFGCGVSGNAIGFVMDYDHLDFVETVTLLAQNAGLSVPQTATQTRSQHHQDQNKPLYEVLEKARLYFIEQLKKHPQRQLAVDYLKQRGLTGDIAKRYSLGYAPAGWDQLIKHLETPQHILLTAGLIIEKEKAKEAYDRFRGRIIFPIRDRRGRTVGFGGRVLSKEDEPKYLNSPETPVFHKRLELYGLYEALHSGQPIKKILIVEGYMDVIALAQHGIHYAVATLGTATSREHLEQLFRQSSHLIFSFDGDTAGQKAAWKALETILPLLEDEFSVQFLFLPEEHDPDSFIRAQGKTAFEIQIKHAHSLSDFLLDHIEKEIDLQGFQAHSQLIARASLLIKQVAGKIHRYQLLEALAKRVDIPISELSELTGIQQPSQARSSKAQTRKSSPPSLMQQAVALLLQEPQLAQKISTPELWLHLSLPGAKLLGQLIQIAQKNPQITTGQLLEHWRGQPEQTLLGKLAGRELVLPVEQWELELKGILHKLQKLAQETLLRELQRKAEKNSLSDQERFLYQQLLSERY